MSAECDGVLQRVYAVLDQEVSADEVALVQHHLEACAPCLEEYEVQAALKALVRRSCAERAPEQLRARIVATITQLTTVTTSVGASVGEDGSAVVTRVTRVTTLGG